MSTNRKKMREDSMLLTFPASFPSRNRAKGCLQKKTKKKPLSLPFMFFSFLLYDFSLVWGSTGFGPGACMSKCTNTNVFVLLCVCLFVFASSAVLFTRMDFMVQIFM